MNLLNVKNTKVVEVLSLTNSTDFKLVKLPDNFNESGSEDKENEMYFLYYDIVHFAVLKTDDGEIRNCICYIDFDMSLVWIDLEEAETEYFIINYNSYSETMHNINQNPLDLLNFIVLKIKGIDFSTPATELRLDCSINQFNNELAKETKFNLVEIVDGHYK